MPPSVTISPTLTVAVQSGSDLSPKQLISIGGISFSGTVLFYNEFFPITGGVPTFPGIPLSFLTDITAPNSNNAPIVYIRNQDNSAIIGVTLWYPNSGGGSSQQSATFNLAPQGFVFLFNPVNVSSAVTIAGGSGNAGAIGWGAASVTGGGPANVLNLAASTAGNNTPVYAEVLIAA